MARLSTLPAVPRFAFVAAGVCACTTIALLRPTTGTREFELLGLLLFIASIPLAILLYRYSELMLRSATTARRQHQLFRSAAEGSLKAFALYKPRCDRKGSVHDFRLAYANSSAKRILALRTEKGLRRSLTQVLRSSGTEPVNDVFARVLTTSRAERLLVEIQDSELLGVSYEVGVEPIGSCLALCIDPGDTENLTPEKIYELREFTQSVIENAPISMIATDASGMIVAMNAMAEQLTLYSRTELIGKHSVTILHDLVEIRTRAEQLSQETSSLAANGIETLSSKSAKNESCREWTYIRKDGSHAYISLVVTTLMTPRKRVTGYLCIAVDVTERKLLTDSVTQMARYDQLTGLANRSLLNERLEREVSLAKLSRQRFAVLLVDIDFFERVNASLGLSAGDEVLTHIARQLMESLKTRGTVARVGGDEFVVLLPNITAQSEAERYAQQVMRKVSAPVIICGREVQMTASIGISFYPEDGNTSDSLLREAGRAMVQAKSDGPGCVRVFSAELGREAADRLELEEDLRHAFSERQIELYYQPQVCCATRRVTGMEMLLRWHSPKRGNVPPSVFLPIAEQTGLLIEIGEWTLHQACLDCRRAQQALGRPLQVAVNLSPRQINHCNIVSVIQKALAQSGLSARQMELEITEEILMTNTPQVKKNLEALRKLGCSISIDDFGKGFSSFSYILEYKVDRIKIDRSFVSRITEDEHARAIVRAIIAMGRGLNLNVVAEGVETREQVAFLLRRRCDTIQGWLFSRALPISNLICSMHATEGLAQTYISSPRATPPVSMPNFQQPVA